MNVKTSILIVEDHPLVMEGIKKTINSVEEYKIVGCASDGVKAVNMARDLQPDVILLDISLPKASGLDLCPVILESSPVTKVVFLTMHLQLSHIRKALKNGAMAYVLKSAPSEQILQAINHVVRGEYYLSPQVNKIIIRTFLDQSDISLNTSGKSLSAKKLLAERELQVLDIYLTGATSKEIGKILCLSPKTIDKHRQNIFEKTKSRSPVDLLRYAVDNDLIDLDNWS